MADIREWASRISQQQKKNFSKGLAEELFQLMEIELASDAPDYDGCVVALTTLHYMTVGKFYKTVYENMSEENQKSINRSFLAWANRKAKENKQPACSRIVQAITQRLKKIENADPVIPELQWYINHFDDKTLEQDMKSWSNLRPKDLRKLFVLNVTGWPVNQERLKKFYAAMYKILSASDGNTDKESMYLEFLKKNQLNRAGKEKEELATTETEKVEYTYEVKELHINVPSADPPEPHIPPAETARTQAAEEVIHAAAEKTSAVAESSLTGSLEEAELEKDGIKLAGMLLTWSKRQVQGEMILKSALKSEQSNNKRLDKQILALRDELFAVKQENADKAAAIASLERQLAEERQKLEAERRQVTELDEIIRKLQKMNENTAEQSVTGYKSELASALKSIVEDVSLPEANDNPEILSALLEDLLDTLRYKGIPLEDR